MAGYNGFSMSNNAVYAYENGEKPKSKWKKSEFLKAVEELNPDMLAAVKTLPLKVLRERLLAKTGWHHTSKLYNETTFYEIDKDAVEDLTPDDIAEMKESAEPKTATVEERWIAEWIEFHGSIRRPQAVKCSGEGIVRGNWFYLENGKKKSINGGHFTLVSRVNN